MVPPVDNDHFHMNIPVKSKPIIGSTNVEYINLDNGNLQIKSSSDLSAVAQRNSFEKESLNSLNYEQQKIESAEDLPRSFENVNKRVPKLVRTYSETEACNFNHLTGARLYDDLKHRPYHRLHSAGTDNTESPVLTMKSYGNDDSSIKTQKNNENEEFTFTGIEDEYIPGFTFDKNSISKWFDNGEQIDIFLNKRDSIYTTTNVNPIKVPGTGNGNANANGIGNGIDNNNNNNNINNNNGSKSISFNIPNSVSNSTSFSMNKKDLEDAVNKSANALNLLPPNFIELPFSQRRKIIKKLYPDVDYMYMTKLIKAYYKNSSYSSHSSPAQSYLSNLRSFSSSDSNNNNNNNNNNNLHRPPLYDTNEKGALVLNHRLGDVIGYGAWGIIRECFDVSQNQIRACKIISTSNSKIRSVFKNEIKIWTELHNENLLPLLDYKETPDFIFAITQRIYGGTLFELVQYWGVNDARIDFKTRLNIIKKCCLQILSGLKYMHEKGIVHADVKLENCLIDDKIDNISRNDIDKILICDFGMSQYYRRTYKKDRGVSKSKSSSNLSSGTNSGRKHSQFKEIINDKRLTHDDTPIGITSFKKKFGPSLTSTNLRPLSPNSSYPTTGDGNNTKLSEVVDFASSKEPASEQNTKMPDSHIGSLPYAAPELLSTLPSDLSPLQDIWAFGVLLYTMILGELPFNHSYEPRLKAMIINAKVDFNKFDTILQSEGDKRLLKILKSCLEKNMEKRVSNVDFLIAEITNSFSNEN
ncbi:hypothetical protein PACTADRAFT_50452 [Pachysolen tannophilus NRRL Y-2460]|uniref:Protein kinase domain-containing protein n=1 Tax=Pachysolen tannophilus NRRL Y-2460 TaxID=669874 RepID=A0A1E4TS74_PACTA|nr:hypothetical protein PACTADRAFT_50452 [Pachysolen tannophilus NRRL Y-2460]